MQFLFEPVHVPRTAYVIEADTLEEARRKLRFAVGRGEKTLALSPLESLEEAWQEGAEVYRIGKRGRIERTETGNNVKSP